MLTTLTGAFAGERALARRAEHQLGQTGKELRCPGTQGQGPRRAVSSLPQRLSETERDGVGGSPNEPSDVFRFVSGYSFFAAH